jgi:hypothetical protein
VSFIKRRRSLHRLTVSSLSSFEAVQPMAVVAVPVVVFAPLYRESKSEVK